MVKARSGEMFGSERLIIVSQKMRQPSMHRMERKLTSRSAVRGFDASALQPDFRILWKVSIFQRWLYQRIFSRASRREITGKSKISFQSILSRPRGMPRSWAWMTVSFGSRYC